MARYKGCLSGKMNPAVTIASVGTHGVSRLLSIAEASAKAIGPVITKGRYL